MSPYIQLLATEYASYFLSGLEGIDRKRQNRINQIEDKVAEAGIEWNDFVNIVMESFRAMNK